MVALQYNFKGNSIVTHTLVMDLSFFYTFIQYSNEVNLPSMFEYRSSQIAIFWDVLCYSYPILFSLIYGCPFIFFAAFPCLIFICSLWLKHWTLF